MLMIGSALIVVLVLAEFNGQPVEQFGVGGCGSHDAEVLARFH